MEYQPHRTPKAHERTNGSAARYRFSGFCMVTSALLWVLASVPSCGGGSGEVADNGQADPGVIETSPEAILEAANPCPVFQVRFESACSDQSQFPPEDDTHGAFRNAAFFKPGPDPLLHIIGIFHAAEIVQAPVEPEPVGKAFVHVSATQRPVVLALSAVLPTDWVLNLAPGVQISAVVLYGGSRQVEGLPKGMTFIDLRAQGPTSEGGCCWPYCPGDIGTPSMVRDIEKATGLKVAAFDGCYAMNEMTISHDCSDECLAVVACTGFKCGVIEECGTDCGACPDGLACIHHVCEACTPACTGRECGTDGCDGTCGACVDGKACSSEGKCVDRAVAAIEKCDLVNTESHYCMTLTRVGAAVLGLDSGFLCPVGPQSGLLTADSGLVSSSIAWQGEYVFTCMGNWITRVSLLDDSWDLAPATGCKGVASWKGGLLVASELGPRPLMHFATFDDAKAGVGVPLDFNISNGCLTVRGDTLFTAWHSTATVNTFSLPDGQSGGPIQLEGYDGWIMGMSVTQDGLLVVNAVSTSVTDPVMVFDRQTGKLVSKTSCVGYPNNFPELGGLVCFPKGVHP